LALARFKRFAVLDVIAIIVLSTYELLMGEHVVLPRQETPLMVCGGGEPGSELVEYSAAQRLDIIFFAYDLSLYLVREGMYPKHFLARIRPLNCGGFNGQVQKSSMMLTEIEIIGREQLGRTFEAPRFARSSVEFLGHAVTLLG